MRLKLLILWLLAALAFGQPTPVFPTAVADWSDLLIAAKAATATLTADIDDDDLAIPVTAGAQYVAPSVVQIDSEVILIEAIDGNSLTVAAGGRGFAGTTPAAHVSGTTVRNTITTHHHNQVAAEMIAVQGALGAGLANVKTAAVSTAYQFTRTNGNGATGDLSTPGANSVTLTPVPEGVNGADAGHYVYISGGTGDAEAVLITGGTAVSGASSGTLEFTTANAHTGAWTVTSATAGIQEAVYSFSAYGGAVFVPAGEYPVYAEIRIDKPIRLFGESMFTSALKAMSATQNIVVVDYAYQAIIRDIGFVAAMAALPKTAGAAIVLGGESENRYSRIQNIRFYGQFIGVDSVNAAYWIVDGCEFENNQAGGIGIRVDQPIPDVGDSTISNNYWGGGATFTGVQWLASNGLKIGPGNKFNHLLRGISIEGEATHGIATLSIFGNNFDQGAEADIWIVAEADMWHSDIAIVGNVFNGGEAAQTSGHINLERARRVTIAGNHFISRNNSVAAIYADTCIEIHIAGNGMIGPASGTSTAVSFVGVTYSSVLGNSLLGYITKITDDDPTANYIEGFSGPALGVGTATPSAHLSFGAVVGRHLALWEGAGGSNRYGIGMVGAGSGGDPYRTRLLANGSEFLSITAAGRVGVGKVAPGSIFAVVGLPTYADNAAALAGGLTAGDLYRTSTGTVMVTY